MSKNDFKLFLEDYGFYPKSFDLNKIMELFDYNGDGNISQKEFCIEIEPHLRYWIYY